MKPSVYLETTIISYLTARPSRDLILSAKIQATRDWWEHVIERYDLFVSLPVVSEISKGDMNAAQKRMGIIAGLPNLKVIDEANELADRFLSDIPLPPKAQLDSLHLALAAVHGVDFLVTWNCRHLANAQLRNRIESICHDAGYMPPIICTPFELMETLP